MKKFFFYFFAVLVVLAVSVRYINSKSDKMNYIKNSYKACKAGEISKAQHNSNCASVDLEEWIIK